ncbi:hypothetical protein EUA93_04085 [Nocardioides oleivorans]|uniref:Uncharacterized protein n=1 Tax=Nocardioides oleivorans TaxID=273676 RepID=A0A4Q2RX73_9ACTN|nr:hypothetical protein EUA93_04085 [Nocardioides oleivorans]
MVRTGGGARTVGRAGRIVGCEQELSDGAWRWSGCWPRLPARRARAPPRHPPPHPPRAPRPPHPPRPPRPPRRSPT